MTERVGFIGLGNMGRPMTTRLIKAGYEVCVYDANPAAIEPLTSLGARAAGSPRELAADCTVVILSLPKSSVVEQVITGDQGVLHGAHPGTVVIDMTSAYPPSTRSLSKHLKEKGIDMLDAPVSGGPAGAEAGTLAVMVGGTEAIFERCRPILSAISSKSLTYVGSIGWGHTIKAINNYLNSVQRWISIEALILATKAGIHPEKVTAILHAGQARSFTTEVTLPNFILPGKAQPMATGLIHKDLGIGTEMALELGVPVPMANHVRDLFGIFLGLEGFDAEINAFARYLEKWAGTSIRASAQPNTPPEESNENTVGQLVIDLVALATFWSVSEGVILATKAGLSAQEALKVINASSGRSYCTDVTFPRRIFSGDGKTGVTLGTACDTIDRAAGLAQELDVPFFTGNKARELFHGVMAKVGREEDLCKVVSLMKERVGLSGQ